MVENDSDSIVYSKNVIEFVTVAKEYCAFMDAHSAHSRNNFLGKAQKLLPLLYLKAALLPDMEEIDGESPAKFVTEVDYAFLQQKISAKLGEFDSYPEVFDSGMQYSETALDASISENLCDIYQDMKDFIMAFRIGALDEMTGALCEVQYQFKTYWGQKLVNVLRAIHHRIYSESDPNDTAYPGEQLFGADRWLNQHFKGHSPEEEGGDHDV
ncbi:MAG TPA: DUF5063 domain-containing protein [Prolixibacteraceae bacterium]|nr:DUF5063 domain-containing protein [Prolixibacteraceae bacterium]